jgi:hypothetical protein
MTGQASSFMRFVSSQGLDAQFSRFIEKDAQEKISLLKNEDLLMNVAPRKLKPSHEVPKVEIKNDNTGIGFESLQMRREIQASAILFRDKKKYDSERTVEGTSKSMELELELIPGSKGFNYRINRLCTQFIKQNNSQNLDTKPILLVNFTKSLQNTTSTKNPQTPKDHIYHMVERKNPCKLNFRKLN